MGVGVSGFLAMVTHPRIREPPTKLSAARDVAVPLYVAVALHDSRSS